MSAVQPAGPNAAPGSGGPAGPGMLGRPIGKNYLDPRGDAIDFTFYDTDITALDPAASLPSQINIDAGTDFYWVASTIQIDIGGAAQTQSNAPIPLATVVITDTGSQRQLMNQPVPVTAIFGNGQRPYRLILPRLFRANSIITFNWTNYEVTNTYNIRAQFHGFRLPPGAPFNL